MTLDERPQSHAISSVQRFIKSSVQVVRNGLAEWSGPKKLRNGVGEAQEGSEMVREKPKKAEMPLFGPG